MRREPTALPRAFRHPIWWCALALLALNDHVLKGSGLLPGSWTGKLSDFAGVIVAPPLLALFFGARRRYAAWCASAVVGAGLCAIDLSPAASQLLEHALAACGLPSRLWPDPSDLWALLALPLGFALSRVPTGRDASPRRSAIPRGRSAAGPMRSELWPRVAIVLGACACLATGGDDEGDDDARTDTPEVENGTEDTIALVLAASNGAGGCSLYRNDRITALTGAAFGSPRVIMLEAGKRVRLTTGEEPLDCGAASVRLPDGSDAFVFWRDLEPIETFVPPDDDQRIARRIRIAGKTNRWELEVGQDLKRFDIDGEPPAPSCPEPSSEPSSMDTVPALRGGTLEFTGLADAQGFFELSEVRTTDDGCYEVDWFAPQGDTEVDTQRLCIPDWAFPFEQGETLALTQEIAEDGAHVLHIARLDDGDLETELVIWNGASEAPGSRVKAIQPVDCVGTLNECDAYLRPIELVVHDYDETLRSGDDVEVKGGPPDHTRVLAGGGYNVGWPAPSCVGDDSRPGTRAQLLELRKY